MKTLTNYLKRNGNFLISYMLCVAFVQSTALAQMSTLNKGDRIKVVAPGVHTKSIVGTVFDVSSTGILMSFRDSSITIPFASVKHLDISMGKRRRAGRGAFLGLTGGALTGGIIGVATFKECNEEGLIACIMAPETPGDAFIMGAVLGGVSGLVLGTLTGLFIKTDRWERIPVKVSMIFNDSGSKKFSVSPGFSLKLSLGGPR